MAMDRGIESTRSEFPQFSELPAELRIKIWNYMVPSSSVIAFTMNSAGPGSLISSEATSIAQICRETRRIIGKSHQRIQFHAASELSKFSWVDFEYALVYLGQPWRYTFPILQALDVNENTSSVHLLATRFYDWRELIILCKTLVTFPALRTFVILTARAGVITAGPSSRPIATSNDLRRLQQLFDRMDNGESSAPSPIDIEYLEGQVARFLIEQGRASGWNVPTVRVLVSDVI